MNPLRLYRQIVSLLFVCLLPSVVQSQVSFPVPLAVSGLSTSPSIRWTHYGNADSYHLQVAFDGSFIALVYDDSTLTDTAVTLSSLAADTGYYWRLNVKSGNQASVWSAVLQFYAEAGESVYTFNTPFLDGWNLVSVPVYMSEKAKAFLLPLFCNQIPNKACPVICYCGGYHTTTSWVPGHGYWIKRSGGSLSFLSLTGTLFLCGTVDILAGWNLIGAPARPVSTAGLTTTPYGPFISPFFGFSGSYSFVSTLYPMRGYWMKSSTAGTLHICAGASALPEMTTTPTNPKGLGELMVMDAAGHSQSLYFGKSGAPDEGADELPPVPPEGIFDVRFGSDRIVALLGQGTPREFPLQISSAEYPLTLTWDLKDQPITATLRIGHQELPMIGDGSAGINDPESRVILTLKGSAALPKEYALGQNYPTPFTPTTVISYSLPEPSRVKLSVYDPLGQVVAILLDRNEAAGNHSTEWDGAILSSGIYFYRLEATSLAAPKRTFEQARKAILVR